MISSVLKLSLLSNKVNMKKFEPKEFNIPKLKGISEKTTEEHLKLYEGYVKNANLILEHIDEFAKDTEKYAYELGELQKAITEKFDDFDKWLSLFKTIAMTRGVGWAMLYYDPHTKQLLNQWVDEQHLGQLNGCQTILALDMWEHSFVYDYQPSGKKQYIEDFFENLNWKKIENNFLVASSQ